MKSLSSTCLMFILLGSAIQNNPVFSQDNNPSKRTSNYNLEKGVAIKGYDPVSYFTSGKAVEGSATFSYTYAGITYHFSSKTNLDLFKANPAKYEPAYGGWCAYAMGNDGSKVEVDPETFKIIDAKLYLFYNFYFNNTLKKWNMNEAGLKKNAESNWGKFIGK